MGKHSLPTGTWTAGALLYSGRPDPLWTLSTEVESLIDRFNRLAVYAGAPPNPSRLGYRGVFLRAPDGRRWLAFNRVAWLERGSDTRRDEGRRFERAVLNSAPVGVLPSQLPKF